MSIDSTKFDLIYGKLLGLKYNPDRARQLAKTLYDISDNLNIAPLEILKYVNTNGLRFDNRIYEKLNNYRTNSSQVGFLDKENISPAILRQIV
jgi:hypothetical protein